MKMIDGQLPVGDVPAVMKTQSDLSCSGTFSEDFRRSVLFRETRMGGTILKIGYLVSVI